VTYAAKMAWNTWAVLVTRECYRVRGAPKPVAASAEQQTLARGGDELRDEWRGLETEFEFVDWTVYSVPPSERANMV
jgi:hypothetical protein